MFQGAYVRQGKHLVLKSVLLSPRAAVKRVSTARSQASSRIAAITKVAARQKPATRLVRRPSKLRKSSQPAQTHCLVYCRQAYS